MHAMQSLNKQNAINVASHLQNMPHAYKYAYETLCITPLHTSNASPHPYVHTWAVPRHMLQQTQVTTTQLKPLLNHEWHYENGKYTMEYSLAHHNHMPCNNTDTHTHTSAHVHIISVPPNFTRHMQAHNVNAITSNNPYVLCSAHILPYLHIQCLH